MKTQGYRWRKRFQLAMAVVAVALLGGQAAVAGLHLSCHAGVDPLDPVHACAVCAHIWLCPAAPVTLMELPPLPSTTMLPPPTERLSPVSALPRACVRAPPAVVS
jgi:hypothetical protein